MTLVEFLHLFWASRRLFVGCLLIALLFALGYSFLQSPRYVSEVVLSVARTAASPTSDYAYDHYYRFQADERLADSLVSYLTSRTGRERVAERAELTSAEFQSYVGTTLRAARLGTNLIRIEYATSDRASAQRIGAALTTAANAYVGSLNEDARDPAWFLVLSDQPVIQGANLGGWRLLGLGIGGGVFVGFWVVLSRHVLSEYRKRYTQGA